MIYILYNDCVTHLYLTIHYSNEKYNKAFRTLCFTHIHYSQHLLSALN